MYPPVDTKDALAVEAEVQQRYRSLFPQGDQGFIGRAFGWVRDWFGGLSPGCQAVDVSYHDLEHTLQGVLCLVRLLEGRHRVGAVPVFTQRIFELAVLAMLLHDTGYLKRRSDTQGTGAKFALTHVRRSVEFAAVALAKEGMAPAEIWAIQNMIRCTGLEVDMSRIGFTDALERLAGMAVGTADLLGQMAAVDYLAKLPTLYAELEEAVRFAGDSRAAKWLVASAEEMINRTPQFWDNYVFPRIVNDFEGMYRFLNDPYPDGPNPYLERIAANLEPLRARAAKSDAS
jgi:hypothetical protein